MKKKAPEIKKVVNTPAPTAKPAAPATPKPVLTPPPNPGSKGEGAKSGGPALEPPKPGLPPGGSPLGSPTGRPDGGVGPIGIPGVPPGPGVPWGKAGVIEDGSFPPDYLAQIVAILKKEFVIPPSIRNEKSTCVVRFKILRDGSLSEPKVVEGHGTGVDGLDQLALNAILKAGRVPPYPPEYSKKSEVFALVPFVFEPTKPKP
jgi:TonB family protein